MHPWNCCRTCLNNQNLHPIFLLPEYSVKYTDIIYAIAGVKIEMNDTMPQGMCLNCITFINESIKFRKKCEDAQNILRENKCNGIKIENTTIFDTNGNNTTIDITDYLDNDFKDFDDNITLDTLQFQADIEHKTLDSKKGIENNTKNITNQIEFETKDIELLEKPNNYKKRKVRVKTLSKKGIKEKGEKVREEIECEYCHKVLTSKLSLRNHYKIHTGFDVICEHCGKKFITRRLLLMHCRAKHGYEKTDKCSYCDYKASNAEQVKIHERLHTGEKPYVCTTCGAGFHRKSSYLQHVAIHLPEKTVQCDQCPARFKSVTLMRIHKNRHRPSPYTFKCGVCENSFARRRNVARHLQRVHGLQADRHIHRIKIH